MSLWSWIVNFFRPLIADLWVIIKKVFSGGAEVFLAQIRGLTIDAVKMVALDPGIIADKDKQKAAFDIIKEKALARGLTVRDSLINLSIELIVAYLKQIGGI